MDDSKDTAHYKVHVQSPLLDAKESSDEADGAKRRCGDFYLPRRVIFAILAFWACLVCYAYRAVLSIGILSISVVETDTESGILLSSFFWGYILPQVPGGWFAKTYGGKRVLLVGVTGSAVCAAVTPLFSWSLPLLVVCRILTGIFEGVLYPTLHQMISQWSPQSERSLMASFIWSGGYAGTVLSMLTGPPIVTHLGWPFLFYIYGALGCMWAVFWTVLVADSPKAFHMSRGVCISIRAEEIETIVGKSSSVVKIEPESTPWRVIFTTPACWAIFAGHFSINWGFYVLLTWIPKFLKNFLKFPIESAGFWAWAPYAFMFVVCIVAGRLADFLITRKLLQTATVRKLFQCIGALCAAAALLVLAFAVHDAAQKWLAVGCLIAATGLSGFSLSGYAVNHIDISPAYSGVLMGLSNAIATIPGIVGVYVTGPIFQGTGFWLGVWLLASSIYVAGAIIFTIFAKGKVLF
eukprot:TRINITY_DN7235_c0_g1_i1.p1 TRINITY_DN7235_c0_g1~~TRINITY_DN7235_c0_g1_i1.p1  ORF type:complete len:490 (+),score=62.11 TRINITY_DN7235_c0_g1_i1:77-1471(+)